MLRALPSVRSAAILPPLFSVFAYVLICAPTLSLGGDSPAASGTPARSPADPAVQMEARFTDGSILKLRLLDAQLRLKTAYGDLQIPMAEVRKIDFATRISDDLSHQIAVAVGELGHDDYDVREAASKMLAGFGAAAYPALLQAAEHSDLEVVHRAEKLLSSIRETLPAEQYEVRADDVIHTAKSKIVGQIDTATLRVGTEPFGKQELKLLFLRSLRSTGGGEPETRAALPDPGTLSNYQGQAGKVFCFQVTGGAPARQFGGGGFVGGAVWGSDPYTLDSTLAVAAVHAGALKSGETGFVNVSILGPQNSFEGSTRNGVTTSSWGPFPGGYKFVREEDQ
jgi:hypothetical protein